MVIAAPSLLTFSIHEKLEPAVAYLVARLDLTPEQLTRIVIDNGGCTCKVCLRAALGIG